jgi:type II secretion system protein H
MMMLPIGSQPETERVRAGFTLIELVLVMAILIIVLSLSGASLNSFFKGRTLESEGHRLLALTRHAQNRAISEGVPMSLWIDTREKRYGLEIAPGYAELDEKASEFQMNPDLEIEVTEASAGATRRERETLTLQFTPDGFMDELNPVAILLQQKSGERVIIAQSRNRMNYEISTNQINAIRR